MEPIKNIFLVLGFSAVLGIFIFGVLETLEERKIMFIAPTIKRNTAIKNTGHIIQCEKRFFV